MKFKVGDKVLPTQNKTWAEGGPLKVTHVFPSGCSVEVDHPIYGLGTFGAHNLELVSASIGVGDKVLVAFEGVVSYIGNTNFYELTLPNGKYRYADAEHTTLVGKAEPVSAPGTLYVDNNGDRFFRTDTEEWIQLTTGGDYHWHKTPVAPLTAFEAPLF